MASQVELSGNLSEYNNHKGKIGKERFFALENNNLNCYGKKKEQIARKEPKYSLDMLELKNIEIKKNKHDDILCIELGKKTIFLIATNKDDINKWYRALSRFQNGCESAEEARPRANTEKYVRRRPTTSTEKPRRPFTSPSTPDGFLFDTIKHEAQRRPLPSLPEDENFKSPDANASNININVLSDLPCCIRHHCVQHHQDGRNMVDTSHHYENVHFIRNIEEWRNQSAFKKHKLNINHDCYYSASKLKELQDAEKSTSEETSNEPIYMNTPKNPDDMIHVNRITKIRSPPPLPDKKSRNYGPPLIAPKPINHGPPPIAQKPKNHGPPPIAQKPKNHGPPPIAQKPEISNATAKSSLPKSSVCTHKNNGHGTTYHNLSELIRQHGKSLTVFIPKQALIENRIRLAEINNGIWFGGFEHNQERNQPTACLLIFGDQLVQINDQWLDSAKFADNIINTTTKQDVSLCVKRLPHAQIVTLQREYKHQQLGIECHRREITNVSPDGIASTQERLRPEATGIKGMNCTWTITHVNSEPIPSNITTEMMEQKLHAAGNTVDLIVQPTDFVQEITDTC